MDIQVLSLMGLWTSMDMFEVPLMGPWTSVGVIDGLWTSMDMFGLPLMGPWTPGMGQVLFIQIQSRVIVMTKKGNFQQNPKYSHGCGMFQNKSQNCGKFHICRNG